MSNSKSLSISNPHPTGTNSIQLLGAALVAISLLVLVLAFFKVKVAGDGIMLTILLSTMIVGIIIYGIGSYKGKYAGIKNNGVWFRTLTNRGIIGWGLGVVLTSFYILLYWFPSYLGLAEEGGTNSGIVGLFNPLSQFFTHAPASQWFVYGTIYTVLIFSMGIKFILKYRHNRYQIIRTVVVMISQLFLAYLIPEILEGLNSELAYFSKDLKYFWPLNYYFFEDWHLNNLVEGGSMGMIYLVWGIFMFTVFTPIITYFVGKRWYCSWVCGCGGLAETAGDSFRHLSSKKISAWKLERWLIYSVLVYITLVTIVVLYGYFADAQTFMGLDIYTWFRKPYGFLIGAMFSGVVGVGFYPLLGNRVWCRFGCPLAGYMGIFQRLKSRFRITTNGGQCISCGNCSTYCEQGIDVRSYAQRGENVIRASCVGCGICSAVCPRGVLRLENGPEASKLNNNPIIIGNDGLYKINDTTNNHNT